MQINGPCVTLAACVCLLQTDSDTPFSSSFLGNPGETLSAQLLASKCASVLTSEHSSSEYGLSSFLAFLHVLALLRLASSIGFSQPCQFVEPGQCVYSAKKQCPSLSWIQAPSLQSAQCTRYQALTAMQIRPRGKSADAVAYLTANLSLACTENKAPQHSTTVPAYFYMKALLAS